MGISEAELMAMLARPRWRIVFQPIRRLDGGTVVGFEALARFPGQLGPIAWIEAAYRFGRIEALDRLLFQPAFRTSDERFLPPQPHCRDGGVVTGLGNGAVLVKRRRRTQSGGMSQESWCVCSKHAMTGRHGL
jgi:hypothetical protein